jgi:hypothetical protein
VLGGAASLFILVAAQYHLRVCCPAIATIAFPSYCLVSAITSITTYFFGSRPDPNSAVAATTLAIRASSSKVCLLYNNVLVASSEDAVSFSITTSQTGFELIKTTDLLLVKV